MKYLFPFLLSLFLLFGCRPETFEAVLNVDQNYTFDFLGDDAFTDSLSVDLRQFRSFFYEVDSTLLQDLFAESFAISPYASEFSVNQADSIQFSITVRIDSQRYELFKDVKVAVTNDQTVYTGLNPFLQPNSISDLDARFADIVRGDSVESLVFIAKGAPIPKISFAELEVDFFIRFTAVVAGSADVPRVIVK